jgi:hypothetical protein
VKCDESKPECLRCKKFGRKCDGYVPEHDEPPPKEPTVQPPPCRKLLSKALHDLTHPPTQPLRPHLTVLPFQDNLEYQYFCIFKDQTAIELSGGFEPTLWNDVVVQACDNASIRDLCTAVAALSIAGRHCSKATSKLTLHQHKDIRHDVNSHLQYALMQYGKALKRVQMMVTTSQDTMQVTLITALLIFVFESLHGDTDRAVTPIRSAMELILKRLSSHPRQTRISRVSPHRSQLSPLAIDEDLLSAFMRLDGPALALIRKRDEVVAYPTHCIFASTYHVTKLDIPSCFASISEARLYLEDIKWRVSPNPDMDRSRSSSASRQHTPFDDYDIPGCNSCESMATDVGLAGETLQDWCIATANSSLSAKAQFEQWHSAFEPLLEHSMTPAGGNTFIPVTTLYIQALQDRLIAPADTEGEKFYEHDQLQTVRMIISLSRRLIDHPDFSKSFVFDHGIIPTLVVILTLCPDRFLKWEACDVVRSMIPRREGVWDSRTIAESAEKMLLEEGQRELSFDGMVYQNMLFDSMDTVSTGDEMMGLSWASDMGSTPSDTGLMDLMLFGEGVTQCSMDDNLIDPTLKDATVDVNLFDPTMLQAF